jgi:hypothetical protein
MNKTKTLYLPLKKKWFDMIRSGVKKAEYRELSYHWLTRLFRVKEMQQFFGVSDMTPLANGLAQETFAKEFDQVVFTLGYPKADDTERRLVFKNPRIRIGTGKTEWGAVECVNYFVITWEEK